MNELIRSKREYIQYLKNMKSECTDKHELERIKLELKKAKQKLNELV